MHPGHSLLCLARNTAISTYCVCIILCITMPITQRLISRDSSASYSKIMENSHGEELLSDKTFAETVGCLRQLSDLALFANEVFSGLLSLSVNLNERIESLHSRSAKLQVALPKLVVTNSAFDIHGDEIQHHRQMLQNPQSQHLVDRSSISNALLLRYCSKQVKPRIQFHTLDAYAKHLAIGPKSTTIAQRYSNPDFFLNQWCTVQVARMKQLEREKKQQKVDKKKRKDQRVAEVAFKQRTHKRKSSVKWQERYMVDGKAVNRKSLAPEKGKGKRLSIMTSEISPKPEEPEDEAEEGDLSLPSTPAHSAKHASPRRPMFQAAPPLPLDLPSILHTNSGAASSNPSGQGTPLVRYSAVYPAAAEAQTKSQNGENESESTPLDSVGAKQAPAPASGPSKPTPPPLSSATKGSVAPPPPPLGVAAALSVPVPLPPKMPVKTAEPEKAPLPPLPLSRPAPPARDVAPVPVVAPAAAPAAAPIVTVAAVPRPPPPSSTSSTSSSAATVDSAPPPPPVVAKSAGPPPPPPVVIPAAPAVPAITTATAAGEEESDDDSVVTAPEFSPKPSALAVDDGDSDGDSESDGMEPARLAESEAVPTTPKAKHYLQDLMSGSAAPVSEMFGMLLGASRPAPPPPPPPPAQSVMTPQKGESSSTKTLLKPRPMSQNIDSARSRSRSSMRLASTDSVSSQLQALSYNLAGIMVDNLEEVPEHEQEEEEIDEFAAVNSTQVSFAPPPPPPPAAAFGRMNLLDSIKQGGGGLRKVDEATTPPRQSSGRESLLDAIKKGGGGLRKVSAEEKEAHDTEKKRGSGLGGFASSSVTAILERRKFLMAEESDSDSDKDDEEWS